MCRLDNINGDIKCLLDILINSCPLKTKEVICRKLGEIIKMNLKALNRSEILSTFNILIKSNDFSANDDTNKPEMKALYYTHLIKCLKELKIDDKLVERDNDLKAFFSDEELFYHFLDYGFSTENEEFIRSEETMDIITVFFLKITVDNIPYKLI